jgi:hypothetical protein
MSALSDYLESGLLRLVIHGTAFTPPTNIYLALFTTATNDAGGGTEVTGGSYARQLVTFGAESGGQVINTAALTYTNMPAATITHGALVDALTAGNFLFHGPFNAPKVVGAGDDLIMAIGDVIATLS